MTPLIKFLYSTSDLSNELRDRLGDIVQERHVPSKTLLLRPGQVCRHIYFVNKGAFRTYYEKGGKSISSAFSIEGDLCVSLDSFFNQQYGIEGIQALEESHVSSITYEQYRHLTAHFTDFNAVARLLLEKCLVTRERRVAALWMQPSLDRYRWLVDKMPVLPQRIMGRHIASYLGMTEVMLSRNKNILSGNH